MARSMTGFGRAHSAGGRYAVELEVRSLNNRSLKVRVHAPATISILEAEIEDFLRGRLSRGAVDVWVTITDLSPAEGCKLELDVVRKYRDFAALLNGEMGVGGQMQVSDYLGLPGVISAEGGDADIVDQLRGVVMDVLEKALAALEKMRVREGQALAEDIRRRSSVLQDVAAAISKRAPAVVRDYRDRLHARVKELLDGSGVDLGREDLLREVSVFAERSDISEELARIDSHLKQLLETLQASDEVGRKLEFVAQELQREVNTIGSKANDPEISRSVIDAKGEVERIREQAANLE